MTPTPFLSSNRHEIISQHLQDSDPIVTSLIDGLRGGGVEKESERPLYDLCLAWVDQDSDRAQSAGTNLLKSLPGPTSDLGKADYALALALGFSFGESLWDDALKREVVDRCADLAQSVTQITRGNPHIVTNNWYMLTHGACLLSCLTAHGRPGTNGIVDLSDLERWSLGRFRAFLCHFGNEGLYHEGTGYIAYTCSMLFPVLVALRNTRGRDLTTEFPALRRTARSMLMGTALLPAREDGRPEQHVMLDWNDTGRSAAGLNPMIPGILMSEPEDQAALKRFFDQTCGSEGIGKKNPMYRGLPMALALYPFNQEETSPNNLPRHLLDTRQGMGIWRSDWEDDRASVFGWYARSTFATPGHAHDDAGSIRLISNGTPWISGAGQARPNAEWQSVINLARKEDRPAKKPLAYPFTTHVEDTAGWVGMELRQVLGCYSERYLSWRTDLGYPFCLAVLDLVDEHKQPPRPFDWNLTFPRELEATVHADGCGFEIADAENGSLHGRFLLDPPEDLTFEDIPSSQRTYSGGDTYSYPGDRFVRATFRNQNYLRILVALVVQAPGEPVPDLGWQDPDIQLQGDQTWKHPFQGAILDTVRLSEHRSNLQIAPSGEPAE